MTKSGESINAYKAVTVEVLDKRGVIQYRECGACHTRVHGNVCPKCLRVLLGRTRDVR